jgi:hypothetical protein
MPVRCKNDVPDIYLYLAIPQKGDFKESGKLFSNMVKGRNKPDDPNLLSASW